MSNSKESPFYFELNKHIGDVVFEKKEQIFEPKTNTIEESMVLHSNNILKIRVQSVALPIGYSPKPKSEQLFMWWLTHHIKNIYAYTYSFCLKYEEKLRIQSDKKEPYINN